MPGTRLGAVGTRLYGITSGFVTVDPPNQAAAGFFSFTATLVGVRVGDVILLRPPNTLEDTLVYKGAEITANDTITIRMQATAAVDGAARQWGYILHDYTPTAEDI